MRLFSIFLLILILSFGVAAAEVDPYAYPTDSEFDAYEYYSGTVDTLMNFGDTNVENKVTKLTAEKFNLTTEDVGNIRKKFSALESELLQKKPEYKKGELMKYRWKKVKKLIDEISWEEIIKGYSG